MRKSLVEKMRRKENLKGNGADNILICKLKLRYFTYLILKYWKSEMDKVIMENNLVLSKLTPKKKY